jgi:hypothetical protein
MINGPLPKSHGTRDNLHSSTSCQSRSTLGQSGCGDGRGEPARAEEPPPRTLYVGARAQAAKMPIFAVTPTEVLEAMHHCMPSDA